VRARLEGCEPALTPVFSGFLGGPVYNHRAVLTIQDARVTSQEALQAIPCRMPVQNLGSRSLSGGLLRRKRTVLTIGKSGAAAGATVGARDQ
jgi:hypothetical protein